MAAAEPRKLYEPCPHCGGLKPTAVGALPPDTGQSLDRQFDRVLQAIYEGHSPVTDPAMLSIVGQVLEKQVFDGFGSDFVSVDFDTPDAAMLARLTRDTWTFASAKNYQQLRDMSLALVSDSGQARSFADFKEAASLIHRQYNTGWLLTEYNQALGSATMAARWNDFEKNAKLMPFLRYSTVGDSRVRDSHAALDGITRKIDDVFWSTHYPPNGWGCRCSVDQLPGSKYAESKTIPDSPVPAMFRTNLAKTGLIYPKGHPYYDVVPVDVFREAIHYLPSEAAYKNVYTNKTSNKVDMHLLHGVDEMAANIETAKTLADSGYDVKLLPVIDRGIDPNMVRKYVYGTEDFIKDKSPDALINKKIVEFKAPEHANKSGIRHAIETGQKQADWIIIHLPEKMDVSQIGRFVKGKMNQSVYVNDVWVINKTGNPLKYDRKGFGLPEKAKRPTK